MKDRTLVVAYTLYLEGLCSCGYPVRVCHHPENDGYFEVDTTRCHANAAVETYRNQEGYTPEPGEQLGAVYVRDELVDPLPALDGGQQAHQVADDGDDHAGGQYDYGRRGAAEE